MKNCELCKSAARVFCESDEASLCWDCDSKVHSANFLVAKHSRNLLCDICQFPTAWNASGSKLGKTVSVCDGCVDRCEGMKESRGGDAGEEGYDRDVDTETDVSDDDCESDEETDSEDDDDDEDEEVIGDDEDGDNQVVPWSPTPPPPAASSSSEDERSDSIRSERRFSYTTVDLGADENNRECTSRLSNASPETDSLRPLKRRKIEEVQCRPVKSRTTATVELIKRFHDRDLTSGDQTAAAATIAEICKLSQDRAAADLDAAKSR